MTNKFTRKSLKFALKQNFTPPPTKQRDQFINSISYPNGTFCELLISQIGFIRKRVWLFFIFCVCFAFFYAEFTNMPENIVSVISAISPLFSLCTIAELYKSTAYNMGEMELACKHNLPKITLMRLGILGTVTFIMLLSLVAIVGERNFGTLRNALYIAVPYLLTSYISLLMISKLRTKDTVSVCASVSGTVSFITFLANSNYQFIYRSDFVYKWLILFVMLIGLLSYTFIKFMKSQEELQWNLLSIE